MAGGGSRSSRPRHGRGIRLLKRGFVLSSILLFGMAIAGLCVWIPTYQRAVHDVSFIDSKLVVSSSNPSVIVSSNGTVLYRIETTRRTVVDVMALPKYVRDAVVAAEDRRFYDHHGVDYKGLFRVSFLAVKDGHASQGASTIEMQLAKQMVNGDARSFQRKLKDIATAQQIENLKSKDEILNLYMNYAYYGEGAFGIEAAAQTYFNKSAKKLTISEAAMLARCVRHPSRENPVLDLEGSIDRRNYVLGVMQEEGWINSDQYAEAVDAKPKISKLATQGVRYLNSTAGYFVEHVLTQFIRDNPTVDLKEGGYRIETTLNYNLQKAANVAVAETLRENRGRKVTDAALVIMDSDGKILAEVGGPDYQRRKFNLISQGHRQPGSSFKPFVYATALKEGVIHMGDDLSNEPIHIHRAGEDWSPRNNGRERIGGSWELTSAFKNSVNLPAIHTIMKVTPTAVVNYAKDTFGFTSHLSPVESLAIGTSEVNPLEMARAYSVFMLRGDRVSPYPIEKVVGPDGDVIKEYTPNRVSTGFDPGVCDDIDQMMRAVVMSGTGTAAGDVPNARGKTGTTQDAKDAWFCGYTDGLVGIGWVGNTVPRKGKRAASRAMESSVYGGTVTAGMWAKVMNAAHQMHLAHEPQVATERVASRSERNHQDEEPSATADEDSGKGTAIEDGKIPTFPVDPALPTDDPIAPDRETDPKSKPKQRTKDRALNPDNVPPDPTTSDTGPTLPPDPTEDPAPKRPAPRKARETDDSDYVEVEVCADTGMRASRYCPETKTVRFRKGTEPRQTCRLHTAN